jgi:hypothetical protein
VQTDMSRRRAVLVADGSALGSASSDTWPALRLKIDTDLSDSKDYMRTASAEMKSARR